MKKLCILFCLAALVCSCEIPFAIDDISEPRFLVECVPAAGDGFYVLVAYADPAYGTRSKTPYALKSGDIEITVNDKKIAADGLEWNQTGNYCVSHVSGQFNSGDKVSVSVKGKDMPTASGSTVIPEKPAIASLTAEKSSDPKDTTTVKVALKMSHELADDEYYGICIAVKEELYFLELSMLPPFFVRDTMYYSYHTTPGQVASMSDINNMDLDAFAQVQYTYGGLVNRHMEEEYSYSPMVLLSGRQFNGSNYSFYLNSSYSFFDVFDDIDMGDYDDPGYEEPEYPEDPEEPEEPEEPEDPEPYRIPIGSKMWYEVEVFRLSEELYNYCKAQYLAEFNLLSNFGVTPPNFTYSNILGGLGVVGGVSHVVTEKIPDPYNKEPEMPSMEDLIKLLSR